MSSIVKINSLATDRLKSAAENCDKLFYVGEAVSECNTVFVTPFVSGTASALIYVPDMRDEDTFMSACDHICASGARAIVRAAYNLDESGQIEAKYKLSPIMLLHRLGVLEHCTIAGGVCLDNDDLDLMAQEGVPLVILPTADAGYGNGYAPVCAALRRGIRVGVGTFDGKYNDKADLDHEIKFLRLTANAEMRTENALTESEIKKILAFA